MEHVTKICADSLRSHLQDNYNIELKPTHAHELVAAYFGYKSYAALREDKNAHINNLPQAEIIVMSPGNFIDQRRQELQGLPNGLPDSYKLGEPVYATLFSNKWWKSMYPPFRSFENLARYIVESDDSFQQTFKFHKNLPMHHILDEKAIKTDMLLTVWHCHEISSEEVVSDGKTTIKLPRMSGHIGYGNPQVYVEVLTGLARQTFRKNLGKQL
jgi:hypothetical protein